MKKFLIYIAVAIFSFGCSDDFLTLQDPTNIAEDNFWQSANDARLGINGIYTVLQANGMYGGHLNGGMGMPAYDCLSDNEYNAWKWEGGGIFVVGSIDPSHWFFSGLWSDLYKGIARTNSAIRNIGLMDESVISEEDKNNYLGQAYFLRALFYYHVALYFEEAPLITEPQTLEEAYVAKNTEAELWQQVFDDLEKAIAILPLPSEQSDKEYGYATKGAALGLLARVALYKGQHDDVLEATQELLTLGYSLDPDYEQLFTYDGENSSEIVFPVKFLYGDLYDNGEKFSATYLPKPKVDVQPMPNMVNDYYCNDGLPIDDPASIYNPADPKENRDPRAIASVYFKGDIFLKDPEKVFAGNTNTKFGLKKYVRDDVDPYERAVFESGSQDFYLIRYADVLLMRAEALVESGNVGQEVYDLINAVRQRVNMPGVEAVEGAGLSQDQLREVVRHERRVELAFEGLRFYDLKRWGEMQEGYDRIAADAIKGYVPLYQGKKSEVFAIPQEEIDVNKNLVQHPAWQ
ncbi:RagB/SusD family nutrient uptake outer membrane protein [Carboxylicivirga mesophila]|uniref:RagB/SusD family nutrient uptake outer membrane protein n=1 Tax=Carboxylicivirga mesophila TaxID=1166478 RepID=A0ABS5KFT0_9BACT|nr:RagB/SusD family nutrient uptake outer membrane protein [Carboxylicivirga mesophila]MBS2213924.1 RagB/SusD family nutrient uptake outer membrane protein [Carboxylicivirga mesophila]